MPQPRNWRQSGGVNQPYAYTQPPYQPYAYKGIRTTVDVATSKIIEALEPAAPVTDAPAETATGTGQAFDPSVAIEAQAQAAAGTGQAFDAVAAFGIQAETAAGTGQAFDAAADEHPNAGTATGTGAAFDAQAADAVNADTATGTGAAFDAATAETGQAGTATGTGAGQDATAALGVNAGTASGTGVANDATVTIPGAANAPAQTATGTGAGYDATTAMTALAQAATGTGQALDATAITFIPVLRYLFRTPVTDRPSLTTNAAPAQVSLQKFYQGYPKRGVAVIIWPDSTVTERRTLYGDEHLTASYVFTGGRENVVTAEAAAILEAAGYTLTPLGA